MKTLQNSSKAQTSHLQFRSIRYKIKSLKQTDSRNDTQIIDIPEQIKVKTRQYTTSHVQSGNREVANRGQSVYEKFRVKRGPSMNQQLMYKTSNNWGSLKPLQQRAQNQKVSYMDTFKSLMATNKISRIQNGQWKIKSRINLPLVQQNETSKFTLLDPIALPIEYVQNSIKEQNEKLKLNNNQVIQISKSLKVIEEKIKKELTIIESQTTQKLAKLRGSLKKNGVAHQQFKIQAKRQCNQIEYELNNQIKQTFDKILNASQNLQQQIFHTLPFQLVNNPQFQQFQQKLF